MLEHLLLDVSVLGDTNHVHLVVFLVSTGFFRFFFIFFFPVLVFVFVLGYDVFARVALLHRRSVMADTKKVELTNLETQWVRKAIDLQIASLKRSLAKEMQGSDIYALRQREISDLSVIHAKF